MDERRAIVRSYQRLFRPDRRIYAIDGRTLPIPGGVPLRWLAYALMVVVAMLAIAGRSPAVAAAGGGVAYAACARLGRRPEGRRLGAAVALGVFGSGFVVGVLDWPLRLALVPAVAATALTQVSPDGRSARRHLLGLARVRVAGRRRLGEALPAAGSPQRVTVRVTVAPDHRGAALAPALITGPCRLVFEEPVLILRARGRTRLIPVCGEHRRVGPMLDWLPVAAGERVEVRA
jgi:hypothetical protein